MEIEINAADDTERSDALDEHIRSKLGRVERVFGDRLTRMEVFLKDVNAGKGGVDQSCTIEAHAAGLEAVAVEATDTDMYKAVGDAAGKLEKAIEHRIGRKSEARRG
ncbi:MAG: ribosome-associated translation inhibitor RaiA [Halofilum sp. (in: g-proteobacteria)]